MSDKTKKNGKSPKEIKLHEGTALKNLDAVDEKGRVAVWVKKGTLSYEAELKKLQIEMMKLQNHVKSTGMRVLLLFEGRDAAGKGGTILRITEALNPRTVRVVALPAPSDKETTQWYFQRYVPHLPAGGEIVIFDRSWYNRAMVEPVMGFCTDEQHKNFLKNVPFFEALLVQDGIKLFKLYFSVSKEEQAKRFADRETDILKQYKISPVDQYAQKYWDKYTVKKFQMLNETNRDLAPWTIIRSDDKKRARINCMKYVLQSLEYEHKTPQDDLIPDPEIIISGSEEIRLMEKNLFKPEKLEG